MRLLPFSNQRYALVTLVFSLILFALGLNIESGFLAGVVGPKHWVIAISVFLMIFSGLLFWQKSDYQGNFPSRQEWQKRLVFFIVIFIYAQLLIYAGFLLTTPLLMLVICLIFNAPFKQALISAVIMSLICYLIFNILLGISLPSGLWFR